MKRHAAAVLLAVLLAVPSLAFAWCNNCGARGCCRCPGEAQCLGRFSTCEEACGLVRRPNAVEQRMNEQRRLQELEARRLSQQSEQKDEWEAGESRNRAQDRQSFIAERNSVGRALKDAAPAAADSSSRQQAAWKQLHCAASILKPAIAALQIDGGVKPDYEEFRYLAREAGNAMDGSPVGVACDKAPDFPRHSGAGPDLERAAGAEKRMVERVKELGGKLEEARRKQKESADVIAAQREINKRREASATRMAQVQRELNQGRKTEEEAKRELRKIKDAVEKVETGTPDSLSSLVGWDEAPAKKRRAQAQQ